MAEIGKAFGLVSLSWRVSSVRDELDESPNILSERPPTRLYTSPESRLAAALIEQAIADSRDIHVASGLRASALKWFGGAPAPLSFEQACALVGVDVEAVIWRLACHVRADLPAAGSRSLSDRVRRM
jgi:hypothetical protein